MVLSIFWETMDHLIVFELYSKNNNLDLLFIDFLGKSVEDLSKDVTD